MPSPVDTSADRVVQETLQLPSSRPGIPSPSGSTARTTCGWRFATGCPPRTVQAHLGRLLAKLDLPGRAQAIAFAYRSGPITSS